MPGPVIILALDSGDLPLLRRYGDAGYLPFLNQFLRNARIIEGPHHFAEMGAWTTAWSGVPAVEHGYHCIRRLVPGTYSVELASAPLRSCPPFWAKRSHPVSIWDAQEVTPDPAVAGEQLCNWRTSFADRCPPTPASHPAHLLPDIVKRYGPPGRPEAIDLEDTPHSRERYFQLSQQRIAAGGRLFREVLSRREHDFYIFGTAELHSAGHLCWTGDAQGERCMIAHHQAVDRELEQLVRLAPGSSRVFLLSTYGVLANYPTADAAELILRGLGYQQSKKRLRTIIPLSIRRKLGEFLPQTTQERLINSHISGDTDWSRSVAFGLPTLFTGYVRINLKGREPDGIVEPGAAYRQVVDQIASDFSLLESPAVSQIRKVADLNAGRPPATLPDIIVSWKASDRPWDEVIHPRFRAPIGRHKFHRNTYHSYTGFLGALDPAHLDGIPPLLDLPEVAAVLDRLTTTA